MNVRAGPSALVVLLLVTMGASAAEPPASTKPLAAPESAPPPTPAPFKLLLDKLFLLFEPQPSTLLRTPSLLPSGDVRLFHQAGDPDSLFTLGGPSPGGELRLRAAFEVNDLVLRAMAPDIRVTPGDTRQRAAGDYRALDSMGRPYQLRLGARFVW